MATWQVLRQRGELDRLLLLEIEDAPSPRFERDTALLLEERRQEYLAAGGDIASIDRHQLFEVHDRIVQTAIQFAAACEHLVVDISALPKRFFFPIIKIALRQSEARNVIATYTVPGEYAVDSLAEDPEPWRHLPMFMAPDPEPEDKLLIVGLGYEPLGLPQLLAGGDFNGIPIKMLYPFPSVPPGFQKNWDFVRQLEPNLGKNLHDPERVNTYDVSDTFDRILGWTDRGQRYAILAPYGPKPVSLAMCLYAVSQYVRNTPPAVYYTQPTAYNPRYSSGVRTVRGEPAVYAYCLRLNGVDLY